MRYEILFHHLVYRDIKKLKFTQDQLKKLRQKTLLIAKNPYPKAIGGMGEPLAGALKGFLKFRFQKVYRVIYKLEKTESIMKILVIGLRKDKHVYKDAEIRINK